MSRYIHNPDFDAMKIPTINVWMRKNAAAALEQYRKSNLEYDDPNYPFDRREDQASIRDPGMTSFVQIRNGVRLISSAPSAVYLEHGNAPDGSGREGVKIKPVYGNNLKIKLRLALGPDGTPYIKVPFVKSYKATNRLKNSITSAFGF